MLAGWARLNNGTQNEGHTSRRLDVGRQLIDRDVMVGVGAEIRHEPLQRMAKLPWAELHLSVAEASTNRVRKARVVVAHDPRRGAAQGAKERLPVSLGLAREASSRHSFRRLAW